MASEDFIIRIILDAQSKIAPVMAAAVGEAEKLQSSFKGADRAAADLDKRLVQLEAHVSKARDTMRSLNPTLDATDRKFKGFSTTLTAVNRNMGVLERNSAKAGAALGTLGGLVERLEKKLNQLDRKMTEMGAKTYEPKLKVDTGESELKINALIAKLASATRGVYTAKTDVEIGAAMAKAEALRKELQRLGHGDRATSLILQVQAEFDDKTLQAEVRAAHARAQAIARSQIRFKAILDREEFERGRSALERGLGSIIRAGDNASQHFSLTLSGIKNTALQLAVTFAGPLLSSITAVVGALVAVGAAAGEAILGLAGLASAAAAQAVPTLGLFALAVSRITAVIKAAGLAQKERDKATTQGAKADNQAASAADALRNAQIGVTSALRGLTDAQKTLTDARREGIRTLTDLQLAEQRSQLGAQGSQIALAQQIASGRGGPIQELQLQARTDSIAANRQTVDTGRGVAGGVEGLPAVVAARRGVDDAVRGVETARRSLEAAQRSLKVAADNVGAAANAYEIALKKLSGGEKILLASVEAFKKIFTDTNGPIRQITDNIVVSFAHALDQVAKLFRDPQILSAFSTLSKRIGAIIEDLAHFFTTGPMHDAIIFFTNEASKNLPKIGSILKSLLTIFTNIARAASGALSDGLESVDGWLAKIAEKTSSRGGQNKLKAFFEDALSSIRSFLRLGGALGNLFLALLGGGAADEGRRGIDGLTASVNKATRYINENSDKVRKFFHDAIDSAGEVLKVFVAVGAALIRTFNPDNVKHLSEFLRNVVIPVLAGMLLTLDLIVGALLAIGNTPAGTEILKLAGLFLGATIIASKFISIFGKIALLVSKLPTLFWALNRAVAVTEGVFAALGLSNPLGWAIIAAGLLVALYLKFEGFRNVVNSVLNFVKDHWKTIAVILTGPFGIAIAALLHFGPKLLQALGLDFITNAIKKALDGIVGLFKDAFGFIGGVVGGIGKALGIGGGDGGSQKKVKKVAIPDVGKNLKSDKDPFDLSTFSTYDAKVSPEEAKQIKSIWEDIAASTEKSTARIAKSVRDMRVGIETTLSRLNRSAKDYFHDFWASGNSNFDKLNASVDDSMAKFVKSIEVAMFNVSNVIYEGFRYIGQAANQAFKVFDAKTVPLSLAAPKGEHKAGGGRVGMRGERGADAVHAIVGRGESILNFAHEKIVDPALRATYGFGLDEMFKRTSATHGTQVEGGFAGGGRPAGPNFFGHPENVNAGLARLIRVMEQRFPGLSVSSTTDHSLLTASGNVSDHSGGNAVDLTGSRSVMDRAASYVLSSGLAKKLKQGIYSGAPQLTINRGENVGAGFFGAGIMADHVNHLHLALVGALGKLANSTIARRIVAGAGPMRDLAQNAIDKVRAAAQKAVEKAGGRVDSHDSNFNAPGFRGPWVQRMSQIADDHNWDLSDWKTLVQGESGGDPKSVNNTSGAFGLGQFLGATKAAYAKFGATSANPIRQIEAMAKYIADRYKNPTSALNTWLARDPHWYSRGGQVPAWGGYLANGTDQIVRRATAFVAGESGAEHVQVTPLNRAAGETAATSGLKNITSFIKAYTDQLGKFVGLNNVREISKLVDGLTGALNKIKIKTKNGMDKLSQALAYISGDSGPFSALEATIQTQIAGRARKLTNAIYKIGKNGSISRAPGSQDPTIIAAQEINNLILARADFVNELNEINRLMAKAADGLKRAKTKGQRQRFAAALSQLGVKAENVQQQIADNAQAIVQRNEQRQAEALAQANTAASRGNTLIGQVQRVNVASGNSRANLGLFDVQANFARAQIEDLRTRLQDATSTGNVDLANQIQDQINELNTSIVELAQQKIQAMVDEIDKQSDRRNAALGIRSRFADLQTRAGDALGGLRSQGNILRDTISSNNLQRDQLQIPLAQASRDGNVDLVNSLRDKMADLEATISENVQALRDNTFDVRKLSVDIINNAVGRTTGLLGSVQAIQTSLSAASGVTNSVDQLSVLTSITSALQTAANALTQQANQAVSNNEFGGQGSSLISQLITSFQQGPMQFARTLQSLAPAISAFESTLGPASLAAFQSLIDGITSNTTAISDNTSQIASLNGSITQSFSSSAWQIFRQAIFDGSGGLLPQYNIPQMATGGYITKGGLFQLHPGEKVTPANMVNQSNSDTTILNVTSPTEVLDPGYIAEVLSFKRATSRAT